MRKKRDLTGQKFGKLTARYVLPKSEWLRERTTWFCTCECGGTTKVVAGDFTKGHKTNCGCMSTTVKRNLAGKRFGMLTVLHEVPKEERTQKNKVMWVCLCDCGNSITTPSSSLVNGLKTSCGCDTITYNYLTGQKYNMLTVLHRAESKGSTKHTKWLCKCDCGKIAEVRSDALTSDKAYSCGCTRRPNKGIPDITGNRFGKLTALYELPREERPHSKNTRAWLCQCTCGETTKVTGNDLRSGRISSCGHSNYGDITGQRFSNLTALQPDNYTKFNGQTIWECLCDCGNNYTTTASLLVTGNVKSCGCLVCPDLTGNKYGMLTVTSKTDERIYGRQVVWKCLCDCGNYKDVATNSLTQGNTKSCGCLWDSSGELAIRDYLSSNNILHETEYSFEDLHQEGETRLLRFDFALFNPDSELKALVEYDGKQHFQPVEYYGGEETFRGIVARDNLKNNYCIENNIPLIRIPYTSYNDIEEILDKALKGYVL